MIVEEAQREKYEEALRQKEEEKERMQNEADLAKREGEKVVEEIKRKEEEVRPGKYGARAKPGIIQWIHSFHQVAQ